MFLVPPFQRVIIPNPLKTIVDLSVKILDNEAKKHERLDMYPCSFEYVPLDRRRIDFKPIFDLIDKYAGYYGMNVLHPRLTRFNPGDYISEHSDTVGAKIACSIRLDYGESKLYIKVGENLVKVAEGNNTLVVFDPKVPHLVEKVNELEQPRVTINFWLT